MATYRDVLAANLRSLRSRERIGQRALAARMRALGFDTWRYQIVSKVESGDRRLTAEEILGLSLCLGVTMPRLLEPQPDDQRIVLPGGLWLAARSVRLLVAGTGNPHDFVWQDDTPVRRDVVGDEP